MIKSELFIASCFCCFINMQINKIWIRVSNYFKHWFQTRQCFQLVFHWISKLIHLTRIRCSGWVRAAWIRRQEHPYMSHPSCTRTASYLGYPLQSPGRVAADRQLSQRHKHWPVSRGSLDNPHCGIVYRDLHFWEEGWWRPCKFPFRKRSMPFSRHLEIFLTVNEFSSTKLKKKENL